MPAKKIAAKKPTKSFEESLWEFATKLRGSVESAEYKHIVLSLIFQKIVSDKFYIKQHAEEVDIAIKIDSALTAVEKSNSWRSVSSMYKNTEQITKLSDILLPKLISGDLTIPEAKQITKEALT